MKFKIGDKVRIRKDSVYYGITYSNPADTEGVVIEENPEDIDYIYMVKWPGVMTNSYRPEDLELNEEVVYDI